jgi:hypothetical protein
LRGPFETQCKDSKIKRFIDNWNKKVNLDKWNKFISRENYMLGDVFPMAEILPPSMARSAS